MEYIFKSSALKGLKKLPKSVQERILDKLDYYTKNENPLKFAQSLKYKQWGDLRYRIGDYRVIFDVVNNKIVILLIGHRREIYQ